MTLLILRIAALLAPRWTRVEWLAEWKSELWYVPQRNSLSFCLGAFRDAAWLRRNSCDPNPRQRLWLQSPVRCLAFLAAAAAGSAALFFCSPRGQREFVLPDLLMIVLALLILPSTTSLTPGEYPAGPGLRRRLFLGLKFGLLLPIVFCGAVDLGRIVSATDVQPHATLIGYVLAFRWALIDQRQRCPVCLRLLTNPVSIGQPARTLLDWYGTEFCCARGHGLLHVPQIPTSYNTRRWLDLDASWSGLFP